MEHMSRAKVRTIALLKGAQQNAEFRQAAEEIGKPAGKHGKKWYDIGKEIDRIKTRLWMTSGGVDSEVLADIEPIYVPDPLPARRKKR